MIKLRRTLFLFVIELRTLFVMQSVFKTILASLSSLAANQASKDANEAALKQAEVQGELTAKMSKLTNELTKDSSNMKIIAILTALFLPGTFMAVLLTTPMFKWPDPPDGQIVVRLPFEIYWAVSGSVTLTLGFGMLFYYLWQLKREAAKRDSFMMAKGV